jgi:hypothetical protein
MRYAVLIYGEKAHEASTEAERSGYAEEYVELNQAPASLEARSCIPWPSPPRSKSRIGRPW